MSDRPNTFHEYMRYSRERNSPRELPRTPTTPVHVADTAHEQLQSPPGGSSSTPHQSPVQRMSVADILRMPGHDLLPRLHPNRPPGTKWFKQDTDVAAAVREVWESNYKDPVPNISSTDATTIDLWFESFAQRYHWDDGITEEVRRNFRETLQETLTQQHNRWKSKYLEKGVAGKPKGLRNEIWEGLIRYWELPETIDRSEKCSKSRKTDPYGTGLATHRSGQTSYVARARKIAEKTGDEVPDILAVMIETKKKRSGEGFLDGPSEQIYKEVSEMIESAQGDESMGSAPLTAAQKNEFYKKVAPRKKGRLFGVGSLHSRIEGSSSVSFTSRSQEDDGLKELVASQNQVIATQQSEIQTLKTEAEKKAAEHEAFKAAFKRMAMISTDSVLKDIIGGLVGNETDGTSSEPTSRADGTSGPSEAF